MNVTAHFSQLVQQLIATGRYRDEGEVIHAGLRLLEERETARLAELPDGHGCASVAELLAEADADDYAPWQPGKDLASVRAKLRARLKPSGGRMA